MELTILPGFAASPILTYHPYEIVAERFYGQLHIRRMLRGQDRLTQVLRAAIEHARQKGAAVLECRRGLFEGTSQQAFLL